MPPYQRKPDPHQATGSLNIKNIWENPVNDPMMTPPKPNNLAEVPYNRLIHHLDYLEQLTDCIAVDRGIVDLIHRRMTPIDEKNMGRQEVSLNLMEGPEIIQVKIWIIPVFSEGVMVYLLFAADHDNLELLRRLRNPSKPGSYDITSL